MAVGFQHPAVNVHIGDGFEFLKNYKNTFDVIITDSCVIGESELIVDPIQKDQLKVFSKNHTSNSSLTPFVMAV